jgi:hypothetical protein
MDPTIPRYMNIRDFCKYSGLTRWQFRSFADRHRLRLVEQGKAKMVDVQEAMALLPRLVSDQQIPDRRAELVERLKAALAQDQTEPQNAA